jgi:hypothetical protein
VAVTGAYVMRGHVSESGRARTRLMMIVPTKTRCVDWSGAPAQAFSPMWFWASQINRATR